jgi:hypothetical protein
MARNLISMDHPQNENRAPRRVFMVLSPRSLGFARYALSSLFENSLETIHLNLITDSLLDKDLLAKEMATHEQSALHQWTIYAKDDLRDHESTVFDGYPSLRLFRSGHPCWRKITDPLLLSEPEEEIVVLDPDLYFPNQFRFEATPHQGVLLMWQEPHCLLPREIVEEAIRHVIPLAHHIDIGVAHWRGGVDLSWLDWLIGKLKIESHPHAMFTPHVEAIVWSAIAMRVGGGYLPREYWHCWRRTQGKRALRRLGISGSQILRFEPFSKMKCFHAGGEAKYWLQASRERGDLDGGNRLDRPGSIVPFVELTARDYHADQRRKSWLRKSGYYNFFRAARCRSSV